MGMFDHVIFEECPFPELEGEDRIFQTKSFEDMHMGTYKIDNEGQLWYKSIEWTDVPKEERSEFGFPFLQEKSFEWISHDVTMELNCYTLDVNLSKWYDVELIIIKGKVSGMKMEIRNND